tara:strand:+ start:732 stop:1172 length:441 start_codon:yes stop_codon:yes gene_type:complete
MATTAQITITSPDLLNGSALNIAPPAVTLTKAGLAADLDQKESGVIKLVTGTEYRLGPLATEMASDAHDIASYLYIKNTTTEDDTYYVDWGIHETMIGRLYAGDWMFIPWNASDDSAEIEIEPQGGTNIIEYCLFNSDVILPTAAS